MSLPLPPATAIWWIRRDLRISDNPALHAALSCGGTVVPVFILDDHLLQQTGPHRQAFLFDGLRALDESLRALGSGLLVRAGPPQAALADLLRESGAVVIFAEEDVSPYARRRDAIVSATLPLRLLPGLTAHLLDAVRKPDGTPYAIFTPYRNAWKALPLPRGGLPAPRPLPPAPISGLPIPAMPALPGFPAGEAEALRRLDVFVNGALFDYSTARNRLDLAGTSELSPYLRFGMLSARQAVIACLDAIQNAPDAPAKRSASAWLDQLIWREFYHSLLLHSPQAARLGYHVALRGVAWRDAPADLLAWQQGRTGYPVVDAAMRQLAQTGWMHNRARMIVASFLVKDLLTDWHAGQRWFTRMLVDGDLANNSGGWQWVAGVGASAAPYFRIFNPVSQGIQCDPRGTFVRAWLPELANVPAEMIHAPWRMPVDAQRAAGCVIGVDYPAPLVDHGFARERALAAYRSGRGGYRAG